MLKIYSTFSKDIIFNNDRKLLSVKNGGPALFIKQVLDKQNNNEEINTGDVFENEIMLTKKGEKGKIKKEGKEDKKIKNIKDSDFIIISTIAKEWMLNGNISPRVKIFLDIQGYARTSKQSDDFFKASFWNNIFCIKGVAEELNKLPKNMIKNQKSKCLITTRGANGSIIYFKNKKYIFKTKKISSRDTIGAGDTFFANFVIKFIETKNIIESGNFATKETEEFLISKYN